MSRPLQTLGWITRPGPFMDGARAKYGDVFTVRLTDVTLVFLSDPEDVKRVFTADPNIVRAGEANVILRPVVGARSVLLLDEPDHMVDRKLMLPPFHGERMQRYGDTMAEAARAEIARWPLGGSVSMWPGMQAITLEVIMRAVFGLTDASELDHVRDLLQHATDWTTNARQLVYMALRGPDRVAENRFFRAVMDPVDEALLGEIARRRASPDLAERDDILSMLLQARYEDGSAMGDRELRDELMTLLVAGHETTATSLAWALERLVRHPEQLDRLRAEARDGEDTYLDAVVKETLRLRPVIPIVVRVLGEPMELSDGRVIPKGAAVAPCIYLVHRRDDVYPEPTRFSPDRFLEQPPGTYTWIPFGGGVRRCLGAAFAQFEMKKVLETIIAELDLEAVSPRSERVARRAITLTPAGRATVIARRRPVPAQAGDEPLARAA